jgi:hypothetical protein
MGDFCMSDFVVEGYYRQIQSLLKEKADQAAEIERLNLELKSVFDIKAWSVERDKLKASLTDFQRVTIEAERTRIVGLLSGIDKTEADDDKGWWETPTGAKFGAGILAKIKDHDQSGGAPERIITNWMG